MSIDKNQSIPRELQPGPTYSVDASALIDFKDLYPMDLFPAMWEFVGEVAAHSRFLIPEAVKDECHDEELINLIQGHPDMTINFGDYQAHFRTMIDVFADENVHLVSPSSTKDEADPYVVALALYLDGRSHETINQPNPHSGDCVVICHEKRHHGTHGRIQVPDACDRLELSCIKWLEFLRKEGYLDR